MTAARRESPVPEHAAGTNALGGLEERWDMPFVLINEPNIRDGWFRPV